MKNSYPELNTGKDLIETLKNGRKIFISSERGMKILDENLSS